tara:strand:+ start:1845 stop:2192 length:348 start_codon:yes stop_codon:yes gene_type:complete
MGSPINEAWKQHRVKQRERRRKRLEEFELEYPELEKCLEATGFRCERRQDQGGLISVIVSRDDMFVATFRPVPHNTMLLRGSRKGVCLDKKGWRRFVEVVVNSFPSKGSKNSGRI